MLAAESADGATRYGDRDGHPAAPDRLHLVVTSLGARIGVAAFSPDGGRLLIEDATPASVRDVETGVLVRRMPLDTTDFVAARFASTSSP